MFQRPFCECFRWGEPGTRVDCQFRYSQTIQILASGRYGCWLKCRLLADGSIVVMKKVNKFRDSEMSDGLVREFENFYSLRHPRIIQYLGYFESNAYYNLVMEFAPHGNLLTEIAIRTKSLKYWDEKELIDLFMDLVRGLNYLHDQGVIHRDLMAKNVMIDVRHKLKIAGLSNAKLRTKSEWEHLSKYSKTFTKPSAPELIKRKPYNEKVDVWSVGMVLYQMAMLYTQMPKNDRIEYITWYSSKLNKLIQKTVVYDPEERAELDDLRKIIGY